MTRASLTKRQADLLAFIRAYVADHPGVAPSFAKMADALALKSKAGISRLVESLVERGHLERMPNRARSVRLVDRLERSADYQAGLAEGRREGERSGFDAGWRAAIKEFGIVAIERRLGAAAPPSAPFPPGAGLGRAIEPPNGNSRAASFIPGRAR